MAAINKTVAILLKITQILMSILFFIMLIAMFTQVASRQFGMSISWTEEMARFATVWLIFMGSSLLAHHEEHINITILDAILKGKTLYCLQVFRRLVYIAYSLVVVKFGFDAAMAVANQTSPNMYIPMNFIYLCIPLGAALTSFYMVLNLFKKKPSQPEGGKDS